MGAEDCNTIPSPPVSNGASPGPQPEETTKPMSGPVKGSHEAATDAQENRKEHSDGHEPITCDEVRGNIRGLVEETDMGVGDFQKEISVTPSAYQNFMKQSGPDRGVRCETYTRAREFFRTHPEMAALAARHAPPARKENTTSSMQQGRDKPETATSCDSGGSTRDDKIDRALEVGDIKLDGEDECEVEVYDTCDEVRRKINTLLVKNDIPKARFSRALSESYPYKPEVPPRQLSRFLGKRGPTSGNSNIVFYAAYVFFEKKRIREGRPKSKMRREMEEVHPRGLNTTECMDKMYFLQGRGKKVVEDKYGRLSMKRFNSGAREGYRSARRRPYKS